MLFRNRRWTLLYAVALFSGVGFLLTACALFFGAGWLVAYDDLDDRYAYEETFEPIEEPNCHNDLGLDDDTEALPTDIVEYHFVDSRDEQATPIHWKKPHPNAKVFPSGIAILSLSNPTIGLSPKDNESAVVHYTGWTADGEKIDSSYDRGKAATFPLRAVIPGFSEALQNMREGEKIRVWIPKKLAYPDRPSFPNGDLIFDISLESVKTNGSNETVW